MAPEFLICVYVGGSFTVETQVDRKCGPAAETLASWCQVLGSISGYGVTLTLKQKKVGDGSFAKGRKKISRCIFCAVTCWSQALEKNRFNSYGKVCYNTKIPGTITGSHKGLRGPARTCLLQREQRKKMLLYVAKELDGVNPETVHF